MAVDLVERSRLLYGTESLICYAIPTGEISDWELTGAKAQDQSYFGWGTEGKAI